MSSHMTEHCHLKYCGSYGKLDKVVGNLEKENEDFVEYVQSMQISRMFVYQLHVLILQCELVIPAIMQLV